MQNKKILIVEDDADVLRGYQVFLTAHHYDTFVASDEKGCLDDVRFLLSLLPSNNPIMPSATTASAPRAAAYRHGDAPLRYADGIAPEAGTLQAVSLRIQLLAAS